MIALLVCTASFGKPPQPNIVFSVIDDHGWSDAGFTGRSRATTPTIDAFANGGIRLLQSYVQKVCSPTRTAIMTGRYPHRMGMQSPFCAGVPEGLNLNETLMPQYLNKVGYTSHAVGKWHLGYTSWNHTPTFRGFSSFYGYYGCAEDYFTHSDPLRNDTFGIDFHDDKQANCGGNPRCSRPALEAVAHDVFNNGGCYDKASAPPQMLGLCWAEGDAPPGHNDATRTCFACDDTEHYSTTLISTRASSVIAKHVTAIDGPLFLYLPFQETHGPAEVPTYWRDKVDATTVPNPVRRDLLGKLMALDSAFANISNALRYHAQNGDMLTNTVWVYTTDNGGPIVPSTGMHDDAIGASNWPLRGGKHNAYEGGVRGAAWIWDGRGLDRGGLHAVGTNNEAARDDAVALGFLTYDGVIHAVDWLPTICALAGCTVPAPLPASQRKRYGLDIDGIDHSTALRTNDTTAGRTVVVLDVEAPKHPTGEAGVVRMGEWKLHLGTDAPSSSRPGDWSSHTPWMNVTLSENTTHQSWGTSPQLYNVVTDPSERHDVINDTAHTALVAKLRAFYHQEKDIAVYPFSLGPAGHPNKDGVWEPWLGEERGLREVLFHT